MWVMPLAALNVCSGLACGQADSRAVPSVSNPEVEPQPPSEWRLPEGGVAVDSVPVGDTELRAVDAHGNLWLQGCAGLFVVHPDGIQRYRYLDSPWQGGAAPVLADRQGSVWLDGGRTITRVEHGRFEPVGDNPHEEIVVDSTGVVWERGYASETGSGWFALQAFWPDLGSPIATPRWAGHLLPARDGALWFAADEEIWRFKDGRFWGPYAFARTVFEYYYDPLDDSLSVSRNEADGSRTLERLRFDGESIVRADSQSFPWREVVGRLDDGTLAVRDEDLGVQILDGGRVVATPLAGQSPAPLLSATRVLYLSTDRAIYRYRDGSAERVLALGDAEPEVPAWPADAFGQVLRAPAEDAVRSDFASLIPPILKHKVHVTGVLLSGGFEGSPGLVLDGEEIGEVLAPPEFDAFAKEQGLSYFQDRGNESGLAGPTPPTVPWEIYGYLEPSPCFGQPYLKQFQLVEAYPVGMAPDERQRLESALRARYPQ